jgi:hypothetical protein
MLDLPNGIIGGGYPEGIHLKANQYNYFPSLPNEGDMS